MRNYYNLDGIKTQLEKEINRAKAYLKEWKNVSFPTKKDGTPFKQMSKNIAGATYFMEQHAMQAGEYRLRVNTWCDGIGYIHDEIDVYCLVRYLKDESKKAKTENYQPKQTYLEQVYTYDLDDIKEAVASRIERLQKEIEQLELQLKKAEEVYTTFRNAYANAVKELEEISGKSEDCTLYYMVLDTVKERYPYC